jgi:RNA polymerase sigma-70 factor (ECF subfamily)
VEKAEAVLDGFLAGRPQAVAAVRGWVEVVVRGGGWRFADPEGVVQEVLLKLLRILRGGSFQGSSSFRTFVHAVARHTCIDTYRQERLRADREDEPQGGASASSAEIDPASDIDKRERLELLMYIFQKLPRECRRLWGWVYGDGLTAQEVAVRLDTTPGNVRVQVHRCLQKARVIGRAFVGPAVVE